MSKYLANAGGGKYAGYLSFNRKPSPNYQTKSGPRGAFARPVRARACKNFDIKILRTVRSINDARAKGGGGLNRRRGRAGGLFGKYPNVVARIDVLRSGGLSYKDAQSQAWREATGGPPKGRRRAKAPASDDREKL